MKWFDNNFGSNSNSFTVKRNPKSLPSGSIWRHLVCNGVGVGVVMGLLEICWVYLLPTVFPGRRYELPISTIGRFVLLTITVDVFLVLVAAIFLGVLITGICKLWWRARVFRYWPALIRFLLLAGMLSYFCVSLVYTYYFFNTTGSKRIAATIGIILFILLSAMMVWFLERIQGRFGKVGLRLVWILALVVLVCTITPNYLLYRSKNTIDMELPSLGTSLTPNVLMVTLDTLRADHLACYGNKIIQTPALDALAADGCLFEAAFSQAPTTTPSHCSIMTSTYVAQNGAMNGSAMKLGFLTLAEILQANGYETAAFVSSNMVRSSNSRLHHGFDYYEDSISPYTTFLRHDECQLIIAMYLLAWLQDNQIRGDIVSNRALAWLDKRKEGPFFFWLHYFDPHDPYDAPYPYKDMYDGKIDPALPHYKARSRYAGEVTYTDVQLGRIIEALKHKGLYDDMLIIVTADHGEAFGEKHGNIVEMSHGEHLYDTTQHIPLIIKLPDGKRSGQHIKNVVQLIDLAPTVLEYLGISAPESFQGKSLLALLNGAQQSELGVAYAETGKKALYLPGVAQITAMRNLMSMRTHETKYICSITGERQELYDILHDPAETVNTYSDNLELAKTCYKSIQKTIGQPIDTGVKSLDPRVIEQLRSLGYLGDSQKSQ